MPGSQEDPECCHRARVSSAAPGEALEGREANGKATSLLREDPGAPRRQWWRGQGDKDREHKLLCVQKEVTEALVANWTVSGTRRALA